jgi:hypothetical protein
VILIAARGEHRDARAAKWWSFQVGDVVRRAARAGDLIEATRNARGSVAVCVFRDRTLVVAAGHLMSARLGPAVTLTHNDKRGSEGRIEVSVGPAKRAFRARESGTVGSYDVYADSTDDAVVSIALDEDWAVVNSARRSAVLIGADDAFVGSLRGERLDGTYIRPTDVIP